MSHSRIFMKAVSNVVGVQRAWSLKTHGRPLVAARPSQLMVQFCDTVLWAPTDRAIYLHLKDTPLIRDIVCLYKYHVNVARLRY